MTNAKLEEGTDDTVVGDFQYEYGIRLSILILLRVVSLFAVIWTR